MAQRREADEHLWVASDDAGRLHAVTEGGKKLEPGSPEFARLVHECGRVFVYGPADVQALREACPPPVRKDLAQRLTTLYPATLITFPTLPSFSLMAVAKALGVSTPDPARTLRKLAEAVANAFASLSPALRTLLGAVLGPEARPDWLDWPAEVLSGREILVLAWREVARRQREKRQGQAVSGSVGGELKRTVEAIFSEGGALSDAHPRFEYRPAQRELAEAVAAALEQGRILVAEAGTGTGKSLAYLVPAALWAHMGHRPVVVATFTRALQDQLARHELPVVSRAIGRQVRAVVVKGRANYPCMRLLLRRIVSAADSPIFDDRLCAAFLLSWLLQADVPDIEALSPEIGQYIAGFAAAVDSVRAHYWQCLRPRAACDFESVCILRHLRIIADRSDIIITNHAVLAADVEHDLLPQYDSVIIDEAHHLEDAITSAFTVELSGTMLARLSDLAGATDRQPGVRGVLLGLAHRDSGAEWAPSAGAWTEWLEDWELAVRALDSAVGALVAAWVREPDETVSLAIDLTEATSEQWDEVADLMQQVAAVAAAGAETLYAWADELKGDKASSGQDAGELLTVANALGELVQIVEHILQAGEGTVRWLECPSGSPDRDWRICVAPISVGGLLKRTLYDRRRTIAMTGATLSTDGSLAFFKARCGLDQAGRDVVELTVPSPFDWQRQLLVCVPNDVPEPGEDAHASVVINCIAQLAIESGGGLLALFTSRQRMHAAHESIKKALAGRKLRLLCQDISGERWWLLEQMRADQSTVVLGVRSFWEGIDVPGYHLRCVVVEKLPFAVPDDPLVAARVAQIDAAGRNGYQEYYVPDAIRALRQGVGRLVRTATDHGVVFILDPRVLTRSYGRRFLRSLPPATFKIGPLRECLRAAADWLQSAPRTK
ncbi:MAG: hypothetical protein H5T86_05430 [Armatimonadetes bacterium]|nr:hypothetical protein [Armatimonadota bacterium]